MIKCFLSHSSNDKNSYVRLVAQRLRREVRVFDEDTFEEGMITTEEIARGLDESTLFVFFISTAALDSRWVQDELKGAKSRFDDAQIQRIYPIIIDENVRHDDARIPAWMRECLNIQPILKPTVAARKINARLLELAWGSHPRLRERKEIFVGRNDLLEQVEERLDDFNQVAPIALIASGLPAIGRKTFLQKALKKANLVRESYDFPAITLAQLDSIEDFLLKLSDLGMVSFDLPSLATIDLNQKFDLAKSLSYKIASEGERVLIEDHGVLVHGSGELVDWFREVLINLSTIAHLTFCIASKFRLKNSFNRTFPHAFSVALHELDVSERNGLLSRYARFHSLNLTPNDLSFFADLLTGLPAQALFAIDLINELGIYQAKRQSHTIQQYGSDKAQVVLETYKDRKDELDLIHLLSRFEFISYEVLFDIVDEKKYAPILDTLLSASICERLGTGSDYIRVNEVIRDFVNRYRFRVSSEFEESIKNHVQRFIELYEDDNRDISDYIFSAQEALRNGYDLTDHILAPSVMVKTIKRIYDEERNYIVAVELADRVLVRERFLHNSTVNHVRFIQCQALARLRRPRFFDEVRKVPEPDCFFLLGFFFRISGQYEKAEENLKRVIGHQRNRRDQRAVGELVLVYMQSDEYEKAFGLARENYNHRPSNPINANNYFTCLIMKPRSNENKNELEKIIERLTLNQSEQAQEMTDSMRARIVAYYDDDKEKSMNLIEHAIQRYPDIHYPKLTKADLAAYFEDVEKLREAVDALERVTGPNAQTYRTVVKYKAMLLAMDGKLDLAEKLIRDELTGLIPSTLQRLNERIRQLANPRDR
jgi:Tfp pilus assembly protein PilF